MIAGTAKAPSKKDAPTPWKYLRRRRGQVVSAWGGKGYNNWENRDWGALTPKNFAEAELLIIKWNSQSTQWEYKLPVHCERCYTGVNETYPSVGWPDMVGKHVCLACHMQGRENMAKKPILTKWNVNTGQWEAQKTPLAHLINGALSKPTLVRKEGDIWKLPKASSPMWTEQWGYQGSSKTPYIISRRSEGINGFIMTDDGWACSCPNFTRNTPRTPCKHILNIKLNEGIAAPKAAKLARVDDKTLAEFEKWQREQAAAKKPTPTAGDAKLNLFGATGRKFR